VRGWSELASQAESKLTEVVEVVEELDLEEASETVEVPLGQDSLIGMTLGGRYRITALLDAGGMGRIYLARQDRAPMEVVVKVVAPHRLSDAEAVARFEREARRLESLQHPNIVEMFDYGNEDGRSYLVMEYIIGESLHKYLARRGRLRLKRFVPIAAQILKGIGFVHARGVVVRDIKPANIMLCERQGKANFVKILDFGLAKRLDGDYQITTEVALGTIGFMAPETLGGATQDLKVDVYALGVLFYFMLAGRMPLRSYPGPTEASYETLTDRAPPLRDALPEGHDIPAGLIELVDLCRSTNPAERPADANELVEMLIDTVPASMFRLPSVWGDHDDEATPRGYDTGPIASDVGMNESGQGDQPRITVQIHNRARRRSLMMGALVGGAVAVGISVSVLTGFGLSNEDEPPTLPMMLEGESLRDADPVPTATTKTVPPESVEPETLEQPEQPKPPSAALVPDGVHQAVNEGEGKAEITFGHLVLTSVPVGATVLVDGEEVGTTPYDDVIAAGMHAIEVSAPDHKPWSVRMEVDSTIKPITIELVREPEDAKSRTRRRKTTPKLPSSPASEPKDKPSAGQPTSADVTSTGLMSPSGNPTSKEDNDRRSILRSGSSKRILEPRILLKGGDAP